MSEVRLTGIMLGELLEAAASGCECVALDGGEEVSFAENLRTIANVAYDHGPRLVGLKITLSLADLTARDAVEDEEDDEIA